MPKPFKSKARSVGRPLILSLIGGALVSPIPLLAGDPALEPAWLQERIWGVPLLSLGMLLLMAGLVVVALLSLNFEGSDT